jgi:Copper binding proteins, plastocyanin/azurin family
MAKLNRIHRHAALTLGVLLCAVIGLVQAATPAPIKLTGEVGPGFTITLKKGNNRVVSLKKGVYQITVRDRASNHNFHLVGSGVNRSTSVAKVVTTTWKVTFKPGIYTYRCDPHTTMKGTFRVTS